MKAFALLCVAATLAIGGCKTTPPDTHDADVKAIGDLETNWVAAYKAHDSAKVAGNYADNAVVMTPGEPAISGKDNISGAFKQMMADPAFDLAFQAKRIEVSKSGDMGWSLGAYQLTVTNPATHQPIHDHGSYVTTYQKQADGAWKAVADIVSSEVPPPAPAPAEAKAAHKH